MGCIGSSPAAAEAAKPKRAGKERYIIGDELGKGHFAEVRTCLDVETNTKFAIKIIDKKDLVKSAETVKEEVAILRQVGHHKHVVALEDTFEDEKQFYLVMELCEGGDLFSKIVQEGKYSEKRAIRCCRQLADALQWIHKRGVTHRDLKPENILLTTDDIDADIKVADFGLSKLMKNQADVMRTVCGTWAYCAPEVIARKPYTQAVDNWTLGVLMFILLSGYHPFDVYGELPEPQLLRKIMDCSYDFDDDVWNHVSDEAKNLIRGLLKLEPSHRISLDTFLSSPWIKGEGVKDRELPMVVTRLEKLNKGRRKFRALVLAKLASKKFKRNLDRSRSKNPSSQSISLGSYPHGGGFMGTPAPAGGGGGGYGLIDNFESARSDRSEIISHRTYEVKSSPAPAAGGKSGAGGSPGGAVTNGGGGGGGGVMAGTTASSTTNSMLIAPANGYSPHHQQLTAANLHQHNMYEQQQQQQQLMMQGTASGHSAHGAHSAHNSIVSANSVGLNSGLGLPPGAAHALAASNGQPIAATAPNGGGASPPHQPTATVTVVDPSLRPSGSFKASGGGSFKASGASVQPAAESELSLRPAPPTTGTLIQPGSTLQRASSRDTAPAAVAAAAAAVIAPSAVSAGPSGPDALSSQSQPISQPPLTLAAPSVLLPPASPLAATTPTVGAALTPPPVAAVHNTTAASGDHTPSHAIGANGLVGSATASPPSVGASGSMIEPTH